MSYIENKVINAWLILIIVFVLVLISLYFFKYQPYILKYGEVSEDYVNLYLTDEEISKLNYKLKYDGNTTSYEIVEVASNYILHENMLHRNVKIRFDYDKSYYILELYLGIGEEISIWEDIYNKYMKGAI